MNLLRLAVLAFTLAVIAPAQGARLVTEVITVGYRGLNEIIPVIRPLVPPPGVVTGMANQLIIKTTPQNMVEVKRILATLDHPPANLLISVRQGLTEDIRRDLTEAHADVRSGNVRIQGGRQTGNRGLSVGVDDGQSRAGVRVLRSTRNSRGDGVQRIRVLEGREAFVQAGQQVPISTSQTNVNQGSGTITITRGVEFQNATQGIWVRPRLSGDHVTLEVIPHRNQLRADGSLSVREAQTSVSGQLGQWMSLGGTTDNANSTTSGIGSRSTRSSSSSYQLYVKVERL